MYTRPNIVRNLTEKELRGHSADPLMDYKEPCKNGE